MKAASIISFLLLCYSGMVSADLHIRYQTMGQNHAGPVHSVLIKPGMIRIDPVSGAEQSVLIDLDNGDIVQLHSRSKRYFKINAHTLGQYASFYQNNRSMLQGLIDQGIRYMDASKRQQVEELIKQYDKGSKTLKELELRAMGRVQLVLGAECEMFGLFRKKQLQSEVCISSYKQLGLNSRDMRSIEQLKEFILRFNHSLPGSKQATLALFSRTLGDDRGIPLKVVNYHVNGQVRDVIQATSISFRPIPARAYRIPQDFHPQATPVL